MDQFSFIHNLFHQISIVFCSVSQQVGQKALIMGHQASHCVKNQNSRHKFHKHFKTVNLIRNKSIQILLNQLISYSRTKGEKLTKKVKRCKVGQKMYISLWWAAMLPKLRTTGRVDKASDCHCKGQFNSPSWKTFSY